MGDRDEIMQLAERGELKAFCVFHGCQELPETEQKLLSEKVV